MKPIIPIKRSNARLNNEFADYLRGKRVAIVGRAGLESIEQGEFIDSHDVVIRFNRVVPYRPDYDGREGLNEHGHTHYAYEWFRYDIFKNHFVPEEWWPRLGRKTNVYYHRLRNGNRKWIDEYVKKFHADGGKFICFGLHGMPHIHHTTIDDITDVRYLDWEIIVKTTRLVGVTPLEGTWVICDVLSHDIESAYITGFPCYCNPSDMHSDSTDRSYNIKPHPKDLMFLASLLDTGRVTFDNHMMKLFSKFRGVAANAK